MAEISKPDLHRPQMLDTRNPDEVKRVYGWFSGQSRCYFSVINSGIALIVLSALEFSACGSANPSTTLVAETDQTMKSENKSTRQDYAGNIIYVHGRGKVIFRARCE